MANTGRAGSFTADLGKFKLKTLHRADLLQKAVVIELFGAVIEDTPVGDPSYWANPASAPPEYTGGRLRANWQCSLGAADLTTTESTAHQAKAAEVAGVVATSDRKDTLFLSNSLPYAEAIEYDGHSRQAPAGMVRKNVKRFKTIVKKQLNGLK